MDTRTSGGREKQQRSPGTLRLWFLLGGIVLGAMVPVRADAADTLHSWNSGPTKTALVQFIHEVSVEGGAQYVPPPERIAVFSNDGTLCPELPTPVALAFALDRIKALAPKHPQWKTKEPFRSALNRNVQSLAAMGSRAVLQLISAAHSGMTPEEFDAAVLSWMLKARNARLNRLYAQSAYQPMQELLAYLQAHGFTIYLMAGNGIDFMRPWAEKVYGIPPERVIGSSIRTTFDKKRGELLLRGEFDLMDDKGGAPALLQRAIGHRPIAAFGNADSDLDMLEWVTAGEGRRFALLVRHTDGENEFAYDRKGIFGRLDKGLDMAKKRGWVIADMTKDWNRAFAKIVK